MGHSKARHRTNLYHQMTAIRTGSGWFSRDITVTPAPDTGKKFSAEITKTNCTEPPSSEIRTGHALHQSCGLGLSRAYRGEIGNTLLEQVTFAQVAASGDGAPHGIAPVSRLKVQAVGAAAFQQSLTLPLSLQIQVIRQSIRHAWQCDGYHDSLPASDTAKALASSGSVSMSW